MTMLPLQSHKVCVQKGPGLGLMLCSCCFQTLAKASGPCFIRFKNSFGGGIQHANTQVDERQNSFLLKMREGCYARPQRGLLLGQGKSKLEQFNVIVYVTSCGISYISWGPCESANFNNFICSWEKELSLVVWYLALKYQVLDNGGSWVCAQWPQRVRV